MANYKIVWEIELEADNPLEAAKTAMEWIKDGSQQFYVQDTDTMKLSSVDLAEDGEDAVLPANEYMPLIEKL